MNQVENVFQQNDDQMSRGIGISFVIHAVILSFFTLKAVFFTPESIDFSQAVRIDMVGLPDKIEPKEMPAPVKEEAKSPAPEAPKEAKVEKPAEKAPPKPEVKMPPKVQKDPEAINLEKVKSKQKNAMEKLKAMAALDKIKEDVAEEKEKEAAAAAAKKAAAAGGTKIKGNQVSPGTALTGLTKLQHDTYISDLDRHIKQHWSLPEWLAKRDLSAQVRVSIDSRGLVIAKKIVKSSGNPVYDEMVLKTIDDSMPFPPPPDKFLSLVETDGILIGFPE
ncbi:hypothetical protein D3C87_111710 [compost metagenome]